MALTKEQVEEYRRKLNNSEYMKTGVACIADKIMKRDSMVNLPNRNLCNKTERKEMAKSSSLNALNDHLMERIEWLTDRDIKGEELEDEIKRSEAVVKVSSQIITNANLILRAQMAADNSPSGKLKLPSMIEDRTAEDKRK